MAEKENKRGRPQVYSNEAIPCSLMLKAVYGLPFRALRGLLLSLVILLGFHCRYRDSTADTVLHKNLSASQGTWAANQKAKP